MTTAAAPLWLVGCGNMGGAMLRGWLSQGMEPGSITVIDPAARGVPEGVRCIDRPPLDERPAMLVLAVKPQMFGDVAAALGEIGAETLVVSILAGVEIATLAKALPKARTFVRAMPNLPASIGKGVTALYAKGLDDEVRDQAEALMRPLGLIEWLNVEEQFHAVTALSGSGPAFVLRFIEALAAGGAELGLSREQSLRLALATVRGTAALADATREDLATLIERVRSPGGTTHAGLEVLDGDAALAGLVERTLRAAAERNRELG